MEFKETQAIYLQITDYISEQILLERWKEGERIPSVRELGAALQVNPNTAMRAYDLLQNMDIIFNKRGVGFFVMEDAKKKIKAYKKQLFAEQELPLIFKTMDLLEISMSEFEEKFNTYLKNKNKDENKQ